MRRIRNGTVPNMPEVEVTARELDFLARELVSRPQNLTDGQIRQGLSAMVQLLEHYFSEQGTGQARHRLMRRRSHDEQRSWRYLDIINRMIDRPGGRTHRVILLGLFSTLLQAKGTVRRIGTRARCCWWKIRKRGSTRLCFPWRGIFLICCRCSESPPRIPESCSL